MTEIVLNPPDVTTLPDSHGNTKVPVSAQIVFQPGVSSLSASAGVVAGGTRVTITGHDFTGATAVSFGSVPAASFTVNADNSITAVSPAAVQGTVDVTVTTAGGVSPVVAADRFTFFVPRPVVTSIKPSSGPTSGGTGVQIFGQNFAYVTGVKFGSVPAIFGLSPAGFIVAVAPRSRAGIVDVTVTSAGGTSPTVAADRFTFGQVCIVPKLTGRKLSAAGKALKQAHCGLGKVSGRHSGRVKCQSRKAGTTLPAGTRVNLKLG